VSTPERQDFLAEERIVSDWIPLGSKPGPGGDLALERDIDLLGARELDPSRARGARPPLADRPANLQTTVGADMLDLERRMVDAEAVAE
jgi:hypothetical protein